MLSELASDAVQRFVERAARLYEQEQRDGSPPLGQYIQRWLGWARGGLGEKLKPRTEAGLRTVLNNLGTLNAYLPNQV